MATLAILMLVATSIFTGAVAAESGGADAEDAPRVTQQAELGTDYLLSFELDASVPGGVQPQLILASEQLIQISTSLPFDYCYSLYSGIISDDLA
ncbi:MAG: hypothetical protein R3A46_07805 [Thermomicrobiales bacterium]